MRLRLTTVIVVVLAACGGSSDSTVVVSAASSLTDAFGALEEAFEVEYPGTNVELNIASSATLVAQIAGGAPADVIASADLASLSPIADRLAGPEVFVTNQLAIAVPAGNPAGIRDIKDFSRPDLLLGVCVVAAPCGSLAVEALAAAGVTAAIDSEEPNVRALVTKVVAGELDGGLVYVTDIGPGVDAVAVVDAPAAEYAIAIVLDGPNPSGGQDFIAFVLSGAGREILAEYGFGSP